MQKSRRNKTNYQYEGHIKNYLIWAEKQGVEPFGTNIGVPLDYLDFLRITPYKRNSKKSTGKFRGYSVLNTVRSALSSILNFDGKPFGEHQFTVQYMKGIQNLSPSLPRYVSQWDPDLVLELCKKPPFDSATKLDLGLLGKKVAILIALATGRRQKLLASLRTSKDRLTVTKDSLTFKILNKDLKQGTNPKIKAAPLVLNRFKDDYRIDPVHNTNVYIYRTRDRRNDESFLFLTSKAPYGPAHVDTLRRWVKDILVLAKIDIDLFKPGSTRGASTSKGSAMGASLDEIILAGGWRRSSTFVKWYKRPVTHKSRQLSDIIFTNK